MTKFSEVIQRCSRDAHNPHTPLPKEGMGMNGLINRSDF